MLFDPKERNVNPILSPAKIRTMNELVLMKNQPWNDALQELRLKPASTR